MVLFALKAWLSSIFAWPALMVLYEYRRSIRRLLKNAILWVGIPAISRLFEGMGSGLMGTSLLLWLVSLQRPDLIDAKDLVSLKIGVIVGFMVWLMGVRLSKGEVQK